MAKIKKNIVDAIVKRVYRIAANLTDISPKANTWLLYLISFRRVWHPNKPVTLNDKVLWLKYHTYWNNEEIIQCADKLRVRQWLQQKGFSDLLNGMICVYDNAEKIKLDDLPERFALKLNVGCRCNLICSDKSRLVETDVRSLAEKWMKQEYYRRYAEMQYKDVKPYIMVEEYLGADNGELPVDYKFYCMNGKAKSVMVCVDRDNGHPKFFFMDRNWNKLPYTHEVFDYPEIQIEKPDKIDEAFDIAEKLSSSFPFVRVDLYIVNKKIYFGELTFTPAAGLDTDFRYIAPGHNADTDTELGKLLLLPINERRI